MDGIGSYDEKSGKYTGLLGGVESMACDTSLYPIPYDAITSGYSEDRPDPQLLIGSALVYSDVFITSVPLSKDVETGSTIINLFGCVEPGTLVMLACMICLIVICYNVAFKLSNLNPIYKQHFKLKNMKLEGPKNGRMSLFDFYGGSFGQLSLECRPPKSLLRLLMLLYILLIFWFFQYWTSFISSDMTVSAPAKLIDSLHDLSLERKVQPLIIKGMNVDNILKASQLRSADKVSAKITRNESKSVFEMTQINIFHIMKSIFDKTGAFILDLNLGLGTQLAACISFPADASEYRRSKETVHFMSSYEVSAANISTAKKDRIDMMSYRLFQSGLHQYYYIIRGALESKWYDLANPQARVCLFKSVFMDNVSDQKQEEVEPFDLKFISFLFYLLICGWIIAFVIKVFN